MSKGNQRYISEARLAVLDAIEKITDLPRGEIVDTMRFGVDLECDSLDIVEIGMELEDEFDIFLEETPTSDMTVGQIVSSIAWKLECRADDSKAST